MASVLRVIFEWYKYLHDNLCGPNIGLLVGSFDGSLGGFIDVVPGDVGSGDVLFIVVDHTLYVMVY